MRRAERRPVRRGAALAEAAIIIPVFLTLVLGMLDLGLCVARFNALSQAARQGARQASVHGSLALASWNGGPWGPSTVNLPLSTQNNDMVNAVSPSLVGCPTDSTYVQMQWLDNSNDFGKRVQVTITSTYQPMVTFIFGSPTFNLSASSTMLIAH